MNTRFPILICNVNTIEIIPLQINQSRELSLSLLIDLRISIFQYPDSPLTLQQVDPQKTTVENSREMTYVVKFMVYQLESCFFKTTNTSQSFLLWKLKEESYLVF